MDLTCLGIILVDMFPTEVGKRLIDVQSFSPNPGGSPANVAVAAQRMGTNTAFIGKVGQDIFGEWLKKTLDHEEVNTIGMVFDSNARTTLTFIGMPDENHAEFVFYRNPGADMLLKKEDLHIVLLEESKALHIDSLSLTNPDYYLATKTAIDIVKKKGGFISFDVNYRPTMWDSPATSITAIKEIIPLCDVVKVNEEEVVLITGKSDPIKGGKVILSKGGRLCLVTMGERGAYYITKENNGYCPAFQVNTIDAIGCGDAFLGAILHKLIVYESLEEALQKESMEGILRFATAAGALTSTKRGALPAIPFRKEVELFLKIHT